MSEITKMEEFLQKLAPCIERSDLDACVEEAAQMALEYSTIHIYDNWNNAIKLRS